MAEPGAPEAEPILELRGVTKSFGEGELEVEVLRGIDLRVARGELVALVGPSGCGKTTLLHLLGLLDRPTRGTLRIAGAETTTADEDARTRLRGRSIGFVFQFHHLVPALTAEENVRMPLAIAEGWMREAHRARALELLEAVGLREKAAALPRQLSGGQLQRIAIARALAMGPALVLADEPTGNLDTETARTIFDLLLRFNRELFTAFVVVTHDPRIAERCDRIVSMLDGRIVGDERRTSPTGGP